jgi:hypothetical protein
MTRAPAAAINAEARKGVNRTMEITGFAKSGGVLSKRISLAEDGSLKSDGSACVMSRGTARRVHLTGIADLGSLIQGLRSNEAIALGALRPGLPDQVEIAAKDKVNCIAQPNVIARTGANILYAVNQSGLVLLDFDCRGMPPHVGAKLVDLGGCWSALVSVLPAFGAAAHLKRHSTSAGLFRSDTGARLLGSNGLHIYVLVNDAADSDRFLRTLHARCWLAGLGWTIIGASGQLLERSIVDRMVGRPERLVFEGAPLLVPPLRQDGESRRPVIVDGEPLDTVAACPPLTILEQAKLHELQAREAHQLAPECAKVRTTFIATQAARLVTRTGMSAEAASHAIARQCDGVLLPDVALPFDDEELVGATVADVLADPVRFEGVTLADPLEGVDYGKCKARIMRRADGTPWIHSFAHGRTVYELRFDRRAVRMAMEQAADDVVIKTFVKLALTADLDDNELEELRNLAAERTGISKRTIANALKTAQEQQSDQRAREGRNRRLAERRDPRPQINTPAPDAPWLAQMDILNDVLARSSALEPPARDIDGVITQTRKRRVPDMHAFGVQSANADPEEE